MKHMTEIGIRALKQNASAVVAEAAAGHSVTITQRGRAVAQIMPLAFSPLERLRQAGLARGPRRALAELPEPESGDLSRTLTAMRDAERY